MGSWPLHNPKLRHALGFILVCLLNYCYLYTYDISSFSLASNPEIWYFIFLLLKLFWLILANMEWMKSSEILARNMALKIAKLFICDMTCLPIAMLAPLFVFNFLFLEWLSLLPIIVCNLSKDFLISKMEHW